MCNYKCNRPIVGGRCRREHDEALRCRWPGEFRDQERRGPADLANGTAAPSGIPRGWRPLDTRMALDRPMRQGNTSTAGRQRRPIVCHESTCFTGASASSAYLPAIARRGLSRGLPQEIRGAVAGLVAPSTKPPPSRLHWRRAARGRAIPTSLARRRVPAGADCAGRKPKRARLTGGPTSSPTAAGLARPVASDEGRDEAGFQPCQHVLLHSS